jgi:hypothetical protein
MRPERASQNTRNVIKINHLLFRVFRDWNLVAQTVVHLAKLGKNRGVQASCPISHYGSIRIMTSAVSFH